ncbi:MAG: type II secretion system F family protein [Nevskia sp.]|nr:type II secretion system F family protein [Nevskia sp.]
MSANAYATIVAIGIFVGMMALMGMVLILFYSRNEERVRQRLGQTRDAVKRGLTPARERPIFQSLARRGRALDQFVDSKGETAKLLIQAGWRDDQMRLLFYTLQALVPVVLVGLTLLGWAVGTGKLFRPPMIYLVLIMAVILSLLLPRMILRSVAASRRERIREEVPLFVHMLVMLYDAGLSTRQAFANMVREGGEVLPELGREIQLVLRQIEAGGDTSELLQNLAKAMEVEDLTSIVGVMRQVDRYGGEIREPLHDALKVVEERQALDLRERVNLVSGRMTVVMVLFFFPALMLFIAGPAFMGIVKAISGAGR